MGCKEISLKLPTNYSEQILKEVISKKIRSNNFTYQIENKSLDARNKKNIHWQLRVKVFSKQIKDTLPELPAQLQIEYKKRNKKVLIVGSGPAGFFSAYALQKAGFDTTIIEQGADVDTRSSEIYNFEKTENFSPIGNYAFGEGGAGTFSDGKLTSRTKRIAKEKKLYSCKLRQCRSPRRNHVSNTPSPWQR